MADLCIRLLTAFLKVGPSLAPQRCSPLVSNVMQVSPMLQSTAPLAVMPLLQNVPIIAPACMSTDLSSMIKSSFKWTHWSMYRQQCYWRVQSQVQTLPRWQMRGGNRGGCSPSWSMSRSCIDAVPPQLPGTCTFATHPCPSTWWQAAQVQAQLSNPFSMLACSWRDGQKPLVPSAWKPARRGVVSFCKCTCICLAHAVRSRSSTCYACSRDLRLGTAG